MIVDAIGGALLAAVSFVVDLLPDAEPLGLDSFSGIWTGYAWLNSFLPLTELMACVAMMLSIQLAILGYLAVKQLREWLPFL